MTYYAEGATDVLGPFGTDDEAYEAYLDENQIEPDRVLRCNEGDLTNATIVWEADHVWEEECESP